MKAAEQGGSRGCPQGGEDARRGPRRRSPTRLGRRRRARAPSAAGHLRAAARAAPDAHCELDHRSSFELLVATVLSAQTTDVLVKQGDTHLFGAYADAARSPAPTPPRWARSSSGSGWACSTRRRGTSWGSREASSSGTAARCRGLAPSSSKLPASGARRRTWCSASPSERRRASWSIHVQRLSQRLEVDDQRQARADRARPRGALPAARLGHAAPR